MKYITRSIWILSLISLFTDMASEMLYPIMPIYLKSIGFSVVLIGILEGIAEATAGFSKGYFGKKSDVSAKRVPFIQLGYALSAISKPMMTIFTFPIWIFFARTIDRLGKGVRTGARDALLSDEATIENKAKVFGFHRSMDTFGAVLGPLIALVYLYFYPENYKTLFLIAFIPGILAVISSFFLKEKNQEPKSEKKSVPFLSFLHYFKESSDEYRKLVIGLLAFTLFNSSDVFLLLKMKESGISDQMLILVYVFYNLVYALLAFPIGILADKLGLKNIFIFGLLVFAGVYFGMGFNKNYYVFILLFFLYGVYASATEGVSKAWISNISDKKDTATAIGTFSSFQSIFMMLASSLAGFIWYQFGAEIMFMISALVTLLVVIYVSVFIKTKR